MWDVSLWLDNGRITTCKYSVDTETMSLTELNVSAPSSSLDRQIHPNPHHLLELLPPKDGQFSRHKPLHLLRFNHLLRPFYLTQTTVRKFMTKLNCHRPRLRRARLMHRVRKKTKNLQRKTAPPTSIYIRAQVFHQTDSSLKKAEKNQIDTSSSTKQAEPLKENRDCLAANDDTSNKSALNDQEASGANLCLVEGTASQ